MNFSFNIITYNISASVPSVAVQQALLCHFNLRVFLPDSGRWNYLNSKGVPLGTVFNLDLWPKKDVRLLIQ